MLGGADETVMPNVGRTQGQGQSNKVSSGSSGQTIVHDLNFLAISHNTRMYQGRVVPETDP